MLSFATVEVALLYPAAFLFLLVILPIPFLSTIVANLIAKIESYRPVAGISCLVLAWLTGLVFFLYSLYELNTKHAVENDSAASSATAKGHHHHHGGPSPFLRRKWLAERNMYIHAVLFILYAALQKMARLILTKQSIETIVKAKEIELKSK